ncbi:MAG: hypothetical protein KatS3mg053_4025 [Candidatus Roseilinea sp.]|nr:MAG: hypothetical protein KatS3mg053_4025 [Candidatus Roseilinea sp.]
MFKQAPSSIGAAVLIGVLAIAVAVILSPSRPSTPFGNMAAQIMQSGMRMPICSAK